MSKLDIKPIETGTWLITSISEGFNLRKKILTLDVKEYVKELQLSYSVSALNFLFNDNE